MWIIYTILILVWLGYLLNMFTYGIDYIAILFLPGILFSKYIGHKFINGYPLFAIDALLGVISCMFYMKILKKIYNNYPELSKKLNIITSYISAIFFVLFISNLFQQLYNFIFKNPKYINNAIFPIFSNPILNKIIHIVIIYFVGIIIKNNKINEFFPEKFEYTSIKKEKKTSPFNISKLDQMLEEEKDWQKNK